MAAKRQTYEKWVGKQGFGIYIPDFPDTLQEAITQLTEILESVPEEYRSKVSFVYNHYYDDGYSGYIETSYQYTETQEEADERIANVERAKEALALEREAKRRQRMAEEKAQYLRLKKKFEG